MKGIHDLDLCEIKKKKIDYVFYIENKNIFDETKEKKENLESTNSIDIKVLIEINSDFFNLYNTVK